jgi:hypothetical protein
MSPYRTPPVPRPPSEPAQPPSVVPPRAPHPVSLAGRWCRAVPSLRTPSLRVAYMRSEIDCGDPERVAAALDELCGRAEQANALAREVLSAVTPLLVDETPAEELRAIATERSLLSLGRLLRRKSAASESIPPVSDDRLLATSNTGRTLTLGERKALARKPSRASLEKLLRDPHPAVIQNLLANPRMTEDDVVRLAARRPAFPEVIAQIAKSPVWSSRPRVRMALVQNPGSPPAIAVPLVGLLIRSELREVIAAADVSKVVRAAATELLGRRPPVPNKEETRGPVQ